MAIFKLLVVVCIGFFVRNVMSAYNPMLTYSIRFKKISVQPNFTANLTIDQYKDNQFVNGNIKINSIKLIDKVVGIFYRCDPDGINCEYFQTWTLTDICPKLKDKNQIWSRWYGSFEPPMVCPINKINYQLRNGTFDIEQVVRLYSEAVDYQWRLIQKMYSGDIHVGSYVFELSVFGYRKKKKSIFKQLDVF